MSIAKKAVDSTVKRILMYTGEIIASVVLLILICLPLAFSVPMWIQRVALGTPVDELLVNPLAWFGAAGFMLVIAGLAVVSLIIAYPTLLKLIPSTSVDEDASLDEEQPDVEELVEEDLEEEVEEEELEESIEDDVSLDDEGTEAETED